MIACMVNTWSTKKIDMLFIVSLIFVGWFLPLVIIGFCYQNVSYLFSMIFTYHLLHKISLILLYFKIYKYTRETRADIKSQQTEEVSLVTSGGLEKEAGLRRKQRNCRLNHRVFSDMSEVGFVILAASI